MVLGGMDRVAGHGFAPIRSAPLQGIVSASMALRMVTPSITMSSARSRGREVTPRRGPPVGHPVIVRWKSTSRLPPHHRVGLCRGGKLLVQRLVVLSVLSSTIKPSAKVERPSPCCAFERFSESTLSHCLRPP